VRRGLRYMLRAVFTGILFVANVAPREALRIFIVAGTPAACPKPHARRVGLVHHDCARRLASHAPRARHPEQNFAHFSTLRTYLVLFIVVILLIISRCSARRPP
jgi:hypothetical protein